MASQFALTAPATSGRVKKTARKVNVQVDPVEIVAQLYARYPEDMARLAE